MGAKQNKCCCCPDCMVQPNACCRCIPRIMCVTLTPDDPYEDPCKVQLMWYADERAFIGSVGCLGDSIDLHFYFERDDDGCYFKLRSFALGYDDYQEAHVPVGSGNGHIACEDLCYDWGGVATEYNSYTLTTQAEQVVVAARDCDGCRCFCQEICATVVRPDGTTLNGILHWCDVRYGEDVTNEDLRPMGTACFPENYGNCALEDDRHGWYGTAYDPTGYAEPVELCIELGPRSRYDDDPYLVDPTKCTIALGCDHYDPYDQAFVVLGECDLGVVSGEFEIDDYNEPIYSGIGPSGTIVTIGCAECDECPEPGVECPSVCPDVKLPKQLTLNLYWAGATWGSPYDPVYGWGQPGYPGIYWGSITLYWSGTKSPCDLIHWSGCGLLPSIAPPELNQPPVKWTSSFLCCGPSLESFGAFTDQSQPIPPPSQQPFLCAGTNTTYWYYGGPWRAPVAVFCDPFEVHFGTGVICSDCPYINAILTL